MGQGFLIIKRAGLGHGACQGRAPGSVHESIFLKGWEQPPYSVPIWFSHSMFLNDSKKTEADF